MKSPLFRIGILTLVTVVILAVAAGCGNTPVPPESPSLEERPEVDASPLEESPPQDTAPTDTFVLGPTDTDQAGLYPSAIDDPDLEKALRIYGVEDGTRIDGQAALKSGRRSLFNAGPWQAESFPPANDVVDWAARLIALEQTQRSPEEQEAYWQEHTSLYNFQEDSDHNGLRDATLYNQQTIEQLVHQYMPAMDASYLRTSQFYVPQQEGYAIIPVCGAMEPFVFLQSIDEDPQSGTVQLTLLFQTEDRPLAPEDLPVYRLFSEARVLTLQKGPEGNYQYLSLEYQPLDAITP